MSIFETEKVFELERKIDVLKMLKSEMRDYLYHFRCFPNQRWIDFFGEVETEIVLLERRLDDLDSNKD